MISEVIKTLVSGENLDRDEAREVACGLLSGEVTDAEVAGFLVAMKMKGETNDEVAGFAQGLRERADKVVPVADNLVDTCGTGGDGKLTFNISTAACFIAAGAGVTVAKHGNRSASSQCGSADVLEQFGVDVMMDSDRALQCLQEIGVSFFFAPRYHPAMKNVAGARKALGIPTIFNLVGPLANPAGAKRQVIGVNREELVELFGRVAVDLGMKKAFIVHGLDGMDEFTLTAGTKICEVDSGNLKIYELKPEDLGMKRCDPDKFAGGSPEKNAEIIKSILNGETGPRLDICVANAALAILASGAAKTLSEATELAYKSVASGKAGNKLAQLAALSSGDGDCDVS